MNFLSSVIPGYLEFYYFITGKKAKHAALLKVQDVSVGAKYSQSGQRKPLAANRGRFFFSIHH